MGLNNIEVVEYACNICKKNLEYTKGELVVKDVKNKYYDILISSYKYHKIIRKLILDFKFENKRYLYKFLSYKLAILIEKYKDQIDGIVYVPISLKRYFERGYNQSYIIAKEISENVGIPIIKFGIVKTKNNKRQSELEHRDRYYNTKDVYKVNNLFDFKGKCLLLVDDIYTTGNTVNECSRVLKEYGVKKIIVATVAIA